MVECARMSLTQPLRMRRDYGERAVNPYLNTPPTKLKRDLKSEKDPEKRKLMQKALEAWRLTVPGPFWRTAVVTELLHVARIMMVTKVKVVSELLSLAREVMSVSGEVVAIKQGYFTNSAIDTGQHECERTIKIVLTLYPTGNLVGTMEFECDWVVQKKKDYDNARMDFGDINSVNIRKIEGWAEGLFTKHRMKWKRGWAGPRGAGKYNLKRLVDALRSGDVREEDTDEIINKLDFDDFIVLLAIASFKASNMGISDYRRYQAERITGVTKSEYEMAKGHLISQGYLTRRGALKNKGKEALAAMRADKRITLRDLRKR